MLIKFGFRRIQRGCVVEMQWPSGRSVQQEFHDAGESALAKGTANMNRPTLQQALDSANALMESDDAISPVEIEFEANGIPFKATYAGYVRNVERIVDPVDEPDRLLKTCHRMADQYKAIS